MYSVIERLGRSLVFALEPENAHRLTIRMLRSGLPLPCPPPSDPRLSVIKAGLTFPNPVGLAAGFDKNAEVPDAALALGFGFAEVGTVTPLPQSGNRRPRIFRLVREGAVINRLGFNNEGHDAAARRMRSRIGRKGIVGVNIGANKDSADRMEDYAAGIRCFAGLASYLTVNISSPNTPGLRTLQARGDLSALLARVAQARTDSVNPSIPIFLKIAPDLHVGDLSDIAEEVIDKRIDGVIVSNTTLSRKGVEDRPHADQAGGLSGRPLFRRSTAVLARMRRLAGPELVLVGVGGVDSAEAAIEKIAAGADLVQLYTGMIYEGPGLPGRIAQGLSRHLDTTGIADIAALRDSGLDRWLAEPLD